jgi:predicted metal-dependent hydrolase
LSEQLLIKEEDVWTDEELEEFYEGWSEWATRESIKCTQCKETSWSNVEFIEPEANRYVKHEL